jgi:predicted RNA-binding protein YlxR (DUF448 family)
VRTCVGCRERAPRTELLRVVAVIGTAEPAVLMPDPGRRLPGRGASLHPRLDCLLLAERRRAFVRALRLSGSVDVAAVRAHLEVSG